MTATDGVAAIKHNIAAIQETFRLHDDVYDNRLFKMLTRRIVATDNEAASDVSDWLCFLTQSREELISSRSATADDAKKVLQTLHQKVAHSLIARSYSWNL